MKNKSEYAELSKDMSFDREIAPKDEKSNLMVSLLKKGAYDRDSAVLLSQYPIKNEIDDLIKNGIVEVFANSPMKVYLTSYGKLLAAGEYIIRGKEKK